MQSQRTIAAAPIRNAHVAWEIVVDLLSRTLELSADVPAGSVAQGLAPLEGLGLALIAGGHLESKGLVLVDIGMHLTIFVKTADAALAVEENLNPVPGGADSTDGWILHLPRVGALDPSIAVAADQSRHLSVDQPPKSAPASSTANVSGRSLIDLEAFGRLESDQ